VAGDDVYSDGGEPVADPGWGLSGLGVVGLLFPPLLLARHSVGGQPPAGSRPAVLTVRTIFVVIVQALVLLLVVVAVVLPLHDPAVDPSPVAYAVLAAALLGPVGALWARSRRLDCGDPDHLAQQYVTTFFIGVALAESAALFGFVASFVSGSYWPYLAGVALSLIGFGLIAPTKSEIVRRDRQLMMAGCATSLQEALFTTREGRSEGGGQLG
jgi:peptidoglycan/LPS O-acetylase OafA/YrhL